MKTRPKIGFNDSIRDVIVTMAEDNPGALNVLVTLAKEPMGIISILDLDDMGMRGPQIWVAFKEHCKGNMEVFLKALSDRDAAMVRTVNNQFWNDPEMPKAVTGGASR